MTIKNGLLFRSFQPCGQCGLNYYHKQEKCCAEKARCNKCNRIGHFARVCLRPAGRQKSDLSKQRDKERMTAFIKRKTAECTLPFNTEEDAFFQNNITNNSVCQVSLAELQKLKSLNESLRSKLGATELENIHLNAKNQKLRDINENLFERLQERASEIQHKMDELSSVKSRNGKLESELKSATVSINNLEEGNTKLNYNIDRLISLQKEMSEMTHILFDRDVITDLKLQFRHLHKYIDNLKANLCAAEKRNFEYKEQLDISKRSEYKRTANRETRQTIYAGSINSNRPSRGRYARRGKRT